MVMLPGQRAQLFLVLLGTVAMTLLAWHWTSYVFRSSKRVPDVRGLEIYREIQRNISAACEKQVPVLEKMLKAISGEWPLLGPFAYNHGGGDSDVSKLLHVQSCQYANLVRFQTLVNEFNVTKWSVVGGSIIGAQCYDGMVPWDDDIDIAVMDCAFLDALFETLSHDPTEFDYDSLTTAKFTTLNYEGRRLDSEWDLFRCLVPFAYLGTFKLRHRSTPRWGDMGGIDIACTDRCLHSHRHSRVFQYELQNHPFGKQTVQAPSREHMRSYLTATYTSTPPVSPGMQWWCAV